MSVDVIESELAEHDKSTKPNFGYYRQPNGYITVSVISSQERLSYMEEGWVWLRQYGTFDMTSDYAANHPFELLFMNGGAHEMPAEQVIELGFSINPPKIPRCKQALSQYHKGHRGSCFPMVPVEFPQVKDAESFPCRFESCHRSYPDNAFPTKLGRTKHEEVMHKDELNMVRSGEIMSEGLVNGIAKLMQQQPAQAAPTGKSTPQVPNVPSHIPLLEALSKIEFTEEQIAEMQKFGIKLPEVKK